MIKKIFFLILKKIKIVSNSYSFFIYKKNKEYLIKKLFEEIIELFFSYNYYLKFKNCYNKYFFIKEFCDLFFYLILLIIYNKINIFEIEKEFLRRTFLSGKKEKNFRINIF